MRYGTTRMFTSKVNTPAPISFESTLGSSPQLVSGKLFEGLGAGLLRQGKKCGAKECGAGALVLVMGCITIGSLFPVGVSLNFMGPREAFAASTKETVFVQVQTTSLRSGPQAWAKSITELRYGDRLSLLDSVSKDQSTGVPGWLKVQKGGTQGYVHLSAITSRTVVIQGKSGGTGTNLSSGDVVLAGKGFNADVERSYSGKRSGSNFAEVDRMEARRVSNGEVASFISAGRLGLKGGKS